METLTLIIKDKLGNILSEVTCPIVNVKELEKFHGISGLDELFKVAENEAKLKS